MKLEYIVGDATVPMSEKSIIAHCCNNIGGWGAGFVIPLAEKYPQAEQMYREWYKAGTKKIDYIDDLWRSVKFELGETQFVKTHAGYVANIIGQDGIATCGSVPPIRYEALRAGLHTVAQEALYNGCEVQMPMIGAGLAGGNWEIIEQIIEEELVQQGVKTTVITLS